MKISTRGRYGLRLMVDIATNSHNGRVSLRGVAKRQDISEKYLEQIITTLSRGGFVAGARGANGGYLLAKPASEITVGDILRAVEGAMSVVDCIEDETVCGRIATCPTAFVWRKLKVAIDDVVNNITLEDLCQISQNPDEVISAI